MPFPLGVPVDVAPAAAAAPVLSFLDLFLSCLVLFGRGWIFFVVFHAAFFRRVARSQRKLPVWYDGVEGRSPS